VSSDVPNWLTVISDSSPLILYSRIGRLDLLRDVFTRVIVPTAVCQEVVAEGAGRIGSTDIERAGWILRRDLLPKSPRPAPLAELGPGEAEAIALAVQSGEDTMVVLDDRKARRIASELGCVVMGSARVLTLAKNLGLLTTVGPMLKSLREAGLYLSDDAAREILILAGESATDIPR
jgi:predicted nucleic acid-binding protein